MIENISNFIEPIAKREVNKGGNKIKKKISFHLTNGLCRYKADF